MIDRATEFTPNTSRESSEEFRGTLPTSAQTRSQAVARPDLANPLYPPEGPAPEGTNPAIAHEMAREAALKGNRAPGIEGEQVVWEARYSMRNFIGRMTLCVVATIVWLALGVWMWHRNGFHQPVSYGLGGFGIALGLAWVWLFLQIFRARHSHFYQLTNRRLFVTTGLFRRRRDQMELIAIKDVFERQTLVQRWLSVGTVVVVSPKADLPTFYLAGVNDPKRVMDLVWHYARAEREGKTVQVENL